MGKVKTKKIGKIIHYFDRLGVGIIKLSAPIKIGENIQIKGNKTDLSQTVDSLQANHVNIKTARPRAEVGLKVNSPVRENDVVFALAQGKNRKPAAKKPAPKTSVKKLKPPAKKRSAKKTVRKKKT